MFLCDRAWELGQQFECFGDCLTHLRLSLSLPSYLVLSEWSFEVAVERASADGKPLMSCRSPMAPPMPTQP